MRRTHDAPTAEGSDDAPVPDAEGSLPVEVGGDGGDGRPARVGGGDAEP